ncbi:aminotransferase class V-fold PLP-dependent enzyme [Nocardia thraciensis]
MFTSSGTEANHLALTGTAYASRAAGRGNHIGLTAIEPPTTQATCDRLAADGSRITRVRSARPAASIRPHSPPLPVRARSWRRWCCHQRNRHDATTRGDRRDRPRARDPAAHRCRKAAATIGIDVSALGVDLLTLAGHKMYASKGVAALYIRRGTTEWPQLVAGIVALGTAADVARTEHTTDALTRARDHDTLAPPYQPALRGDTAGDDGQRPGHQRPGRSPHHRLCPRRSRPPRPRFPATGYRACASPRREPEAATHHGLKLLSISMAKFLIRRG